MVCKEEKDHGDKGILLGSRLKDGDRVIIIEDVTIININCAMVWLIIQMFHHFGHSYYSFVNQRRKIIGREIKDIILSNEAYFIEIGIGIQCILVG